MRNPAIYESQRSEFNNAPTLVYGNTRADLFPLHG